MAFVTAPLHRAWAQKVLPGLRIDTVARVFRYRPAGLRHAPAHAEFSRSTVDRRGMAYTSRRTHGRKLFRVTHQRHHVDPHGQPPSPAPYPDGFPLYRYFRIPSAGQGALRSEVSPRSARCRFEFQTVTHTTGVVFEDLACGGAERQFPQTRIFTRPEKPISLVPASLLRDVLIPPTPLARIAGTLHRVSTLLTQVGLPHAPEVAGMAASSAG